MGVQPPSQKMCRILALSMMFAFVLINASTSPEELPFDEFTESFDDGPEAYALDKANKAEKEAKKLHSSLKAASEQTAKTHASSQSSATAAEKTLKQSRTNELSQKQKCKEAESARASSQSSSTAAEKTLKASKTKETTEKQNCKAAEEARASAAAHKKASDKALSESAAQEKTAKNKENASETRAKGAAKAQKDARERNDKEITNKEKVSKEKVSKERTKKELEAKSRGRASKEKAFKKKHTCTVTASEHNNYGGKVAQKVSYCGTEQNFRFATKSWSRRRGFAASSFRLSSGCKQVQLWDEDKCRKNYSDNVNIQKSVSSVKWDLNDDICGITVWSSAGKTC